VLAEGTPHDLINTGSEALEVIGFFSAPAVNQRWGDVMLPQQPCDWLAERLRVAARLPNF
jgi:hypothetical protein